MTSIFSQIISGKIPSKKIYEDDHCIVIPDIKPVAPIHYLIIPKKALKMLSSATIDDKDLLGHLLLVASKVANQLGVNEGYRIVINNGEEGGQTVFHLHLHLIAGFSQKESDM